MKNAMRQTGIIFFVEIKEKEGFKVLSQGKTGEIVILLDEHHQIVELSDNVEKEYGIPLSANLGLMPVAKFLLRYPDTCGRFR